jgi:CSLREA domain-containing protein
VQEEEAQEARRRSEEEEVQEEAEEEVIIAARHALAAALVILLALPAGAAATTINVTSTADGKTNDQLCTLREAVDAANTNAAVNPAGGNDCPGGQPAPNTDSIVLGSATYAIAGAADDDVNASGDLDIDGPSGPVVIDGQGPAVSKIDANDTDRVLDTIDFARLTLTDLTVTDGTVTNAFGGGIRASFADLRLDDVVVSANTINGTNANSMLGAGILALTSLTMTNSTVGPNNVILSSGAGAGTPRGGGIFLASSAPGVIDRSTIKQNGILGAASQTLLGGGIATQDAEEDLTITNSTITDNGLLGGGTRRGGGVYWEENGDDDTLRVTNSTFERNSVGSLQNGGGMYVDGGTGNTIAFSTFGPTTPTDMNGAGLYNNGSVAVRASVFETGTNDDCGGALPGSLGFNYEKSGDDCFFSEPSDVLTTEQLLDGAGLIDNGGPTETIALVAGSPALNAVPSASCLDAASQPLFADERGVERPFGSGCDPGAYEQASCEGQTIGAGWLIGTTGPDSLSGTPGSDLIATGAGADTLDPGTGADRVCTGAGADSLQLTDGTTDLADCGADLDTVHSDPGVDQLAGCESVNPVTPVSPVIPTSTSQTPKKKKCKKKKHRRSAFSAKKKCKKKRR